MSDVMVSQGPAYLCERCGSVLPYASKLCSICKGDRIYELETALSAAEARETAFRERAERAEHEADRLAVGIAADARPAEILSETAYRMAMRQGEQQAYAAANADNRALRERVSALEAGLREIEKRTRPGGDMADQAVNAAARALVPASGSEPGAATATREE